VAGSERDDRSVEEGFERNVVPYEFEYAFVLEYAPAYSPGVAP